MPVKPGAVSLHNKPETFVKIGFQQNENITVWPDIVQLQSDFIL